MLERHGRNGNIGRGFVTGFGALRGAIASSIGHDSHNLIVVGDDDGRHGRGGQPADRAAGRRRRGARAARSWPSCRCRSPGLMSDRAFDFVEARLRPLRARRRRLRLRA